MSHSNAQVQKISCPTTLQQIVI